MVFTSRFIGVLAGGCVLCLALSHCQSDSRYSRDADELAAQARAEFPDTTIGRDGMTVDVPFRPASA